MALYGPLWLGRWAIYRSIWHLQYGTAFAKEWHQVFFHDPEGNVIEVHQAVG